MKSIVIVGGGIAGLATAHAIKSRDRDARVVVLERHERAGGNIRTEVVDGYVCEWGPDGFLDNAPDTLRLASAVGLDSRLRPSSDSARRRFIFRNNVLHELPTSATAFLRSALLSIGGKARIFCEPFARTRPEGDETIFDFAARRIGREAASAMIDSMVSGIFAGDAHALSLRACFPKMWQMETDHGSLVRAMIATRKRRTKDDAMGTPAGRLTSFEGGMEDLSRALVAALGPSVRTAAPVTALRKGAAAAPFLPALDGQGYTVFTGGESIEADAVVLAGPAAETASLIGPFDSTLASVIGGISTASLAVVCLGYDEAALAADRGPLNGFGFLVPRSEKIRILGALWETSIYPNRAPAGKALIRVMIGGALDPRAVDLSDRDLLSAVRADLHRTMGLQIEPELVQIFRHPRGIPQYTTGHVARLRRIDSLLQPHPGLFLAGNSYRGVAINSCIAEAGPLADRVLAYAAVSSARRAQLV